MHAVSAQVQLGRRWPSHHRRRSGDRTGSDRSRGVGSGQAKPDGNRSPRRQGEVVPEPDLGADPERVDRVHPAVDDAILKGVLGERGGVRDAPQPLQIRLVLAEQQGGAVVGGRGASTVFDGNQISLAAAKQIAKVCRDFAAGKNGSMSLYVLDTFGEFVHMERMDGQVFNNIRTALMKAQTSLRTRVPTSVYNAQGRNNPAGQNRTIAQYDFFTNSGGIPIVVDGQMIGVVHR